MKSFNTFGVMIDMSRNAVMTDAILPFGEKGKTMLYTGKLSTNFE